MANIPIPPPNVPLISDDGRVNNAWYRYFVSLNVTADSGAAGSVSTDPGSGLTGGGSVSAGISLSIADNGVTNAKLRQSAGTSVIGRSASSTGNVADITAAANKSVLAREAGALVFTTDPTVEDLTCDTLRINATPTAAVVVQSHYATINFNGTPYKVLLAP